MRQDRIGLWLIGARGGVATTAITGLAALARGRIGETGLVSALPRWKNLPFPAWGDFHVGGHEIREVDLFDEAMCLAKHSRAFDADLVRDLKDAYEAVDREIRPGTVYGVGPKIESLASGNVPRDTAAEGLLRIREDLRRFQKENGLDHVIVVDVASTEPAAEFEAPAETWEEIASLMDSADCPLPASSLYAIAALDLGCSFINFTPSLGCELPGIDDLARRRKSRHMGRDGKTGETLMKSVLAPMFHDRNLRVLSWVGHNIFGNLDGKVLDDPSNKATKVASKDRLLGEILEYKPQTLVSIEYIESMGDWKTAWDHVHFQGFLGTPMQLQFIWQGCDSLLAAPLVLDLARFAELARRRGHVGRMDFLASFFKSPDGATEQGFIRQYQALEAFCETDMTARHGEANQA